MVLLYENTPDELYSLNCEELCKRLYKVFGMDKSGRIKLVYHQEARPSKETGIKNGSFKKGEKFRPRIIMYYTQFNALVQDYDFEINDLGQITFLNR